MLIINLLLCLPRPSKSCVCNIMRSMIMTLFLALSRQRPCESMCNISKPTIVMLILRTRRPSTSVMRTNTMYRTLSVGAVRRTGPLP
eukprot:5892081-Alexandrium_andersonii.AAC.1